MQSTQCLNAYETELTSLLYASLQCQIVSNSKLQDAKGLLQESPFAPVPLNCNKVVLMSSFLAVLLVIICHSLDTLQGRYIVLSSLKLLVLLQKQLSMFFLF